MCITSYLRRNVPAPSPIAQPRNRHGPEHPRASMRERPQQTAGSTGQRSTVHPYRRGSEADGVPATWLSADPRWYKHE